MSDFKEKLNLLEPEKIIEKAQKLGASYADVRYQHFSNEQIRVENKALEDYKSLDFGGLGIRVVVNGAVGFASTSDLTKSSIDNSIEAAIKLAKSFESNKGNFADAETIKLDDKVSVKTNPINVLLT